MALIELKTVKTANSDTIRQVFIMLERGVGMVPDTLSFLANSPGLFEIQKNQIGYYQNHPNLSPELLALIRYTSACWFKNNACIAFNGSMLEKQGMTRNELEQLCADPVQAPLEEKDRALLSFVYKGIRDQDSATEKDLENLRSLGWTDSDIIDAVNHGFSMFAPGKILDLFKLN